MTIPPTTICQPKYLLKAIPKFKAEITIIPAIPIPEAIKGKAIQKGIPNKKATIEPVQPPVTGNGKATKITKAIRVPYFNFLELYLSLVLFKNQLRNFSQILNFFEKYFKIGSKNKSKKITGTRLPATETK